MFTKEIAAFIALPGIVGPHHYKRTPIWLGMRLLIPLFIVTLGLLQTHCHGIRGEGAGSYLSDFEPAEQDALLLFKVIRLGATYGDVHKRVPGLDELAPEGGSAFLAALGLHEATASTDLFNTETKMEFNFEKGALYSCFFFMREFEPDTADRLFHRIQAFYASVFGHGAEEEGEDDRLSKSIYWFSNDLEVVVSIVAENEVSTLSWGFQQPGPNTEYLRRQ
ncbi:hypothetical protein [Desulfosarcina sp.]|uniref:hypothetical protein n=1 Tax=Desulfosarcina sp. TaxID=2027861 RepID=UPI0035669467